MDSTCDALFFSDQGFPDPEGYTDPEPNYVPRFGCGCLWVLLMVLQRLGCAALAQCLLRVDSLYRVVSWVMGTRRRSTFCLLTHPCAMSPRPFFVPNAQSLTRNPSNCNDGGCGGQTAGDRIRWQGCVEKRAKVPPRPSSPGRLS